MSLLTEPFNPRYLEALEQFRLIDDTFFDAHMDGNIEAMQLLLNIFFHRDDIIVKEVVTQKSANNLYGRSARFDVIAVDSDSKIYNCEIQRANEGASPKRARFNNSLIDSREINKGTKYQDFPEIWVIFITENDIFGAQLPMYHVERNIIELNKPFDDAAHIIYVNGEYRGDNNMGLLMHDFFCADPAKMHFPELAKRADFLKHNNKGVKAMCEIMQKLQAEGHAAGLAEGRLEGRLEERTSLALDMLRDKKPMDEIIKYSRLTPERIEELAHQLQ
ncbi:MAG: PD-(D/E)XK nuclease family transposase [Selenomonas sp.]|nr:PD-(D/E)XK nuclease family transposase [Selenomonas sp.]